MSNIAFLTLTNDSLTIRNTEGWKAIAITVDTLSTADATIEGSEGTISGQAAGQVILKPSAVFTYSVGDYNDIDGLTITAPLGCTCKIVAARALDSFLPAKNQTLYIDEGNGLAGIIFGGQVANYSALPDATLYTGRLFYVINSQGTEWLPGSLGGTYYPSGWYYCTGTAYLYQETAFQASQATVNAGTNSDQFVTPLTLTNSTQLAAKLDDISADTKEVTGFTDPFLITCAYDSTARTITLTGTVKAYWRGKTIPVLINGWVSDPHPNIAGNYFLKYDGSVFTWSAVAWDFSELQIAIAFFQTGYKFGLKETHCFMPWQCHRSDHISKGTIFISGGDLSSFTLNSTTATNRRPQISSTSLLDEDLGHILAALSTNSYTWLSLTGAGSVALTTAQAEIINLSTNQPFYNQFNGGAWQQTLLPVNAYQKIFVMAIPVTSDAGSQAYRYVFIQGQTQSTTLATIRAVTAASLNLGELSGGLPEYCFIGEIIIRYAANNWTLISVSKITGNRVVQTTTPAGNYLSQVSADTNFSGDGTTADPLTLKEIETVKDGSDTALGGANVRLSNLDGSRKVAFQLDANNDLSIYRLNAGSWARRMILSVGNAAIRLFSSFDSVNPKIYLNTNGPSYINNTSNFGIGNNNPTEKLEVTGTFKATGNSSISGTLGVTGAVSLSSTLGVSGLANFTGGMKPRVVSGVNYPPNTTQFPNDNELGIYLHLSGSGFWYLVYNYGGALKIMQLN